MIYNVWLRQRARDTGEMLYSLFSESSMSRDKAEALQHQWPALSLHVFREGFEPERNVGYLSGKGKLSTRGRELKASYMQALEALAKMENFRFKSALKRQLALASRHLWTLDEVREKILDTAE